MSAPMHTPWAVVTSPTDDGMYAVQGAYLVADNLPIEDANLIAAAPEMLEALVFARANLAGLVHRVMTAPLGDALLKANNDLADAYDNLAAAIAKARGAA